MYSAGIIGANTTRIMRIGTKVVDKVGTFKGYSSETSGGNIIQSVDPSLDLTEAIGYMQNNSVIIGGTSFFIVTLQVLTNFQVTLTLADPSHNLSQNSFTSITTTGGTLNSSAAGSFTQTTSESVDISTWIWTSGTAGFIDQTAPDYTNKLFPHTFVEFA